MPAFFQPIAPRIYEAVAPSSLAILRFWRMGGNVFQPICTVYYQFGMYAQLSPSRHIKINNIHINVNVKHASVAWLNNRIQALAEANWKGAEETIKKKKKARYKNKVVLHNFSGP